MISVLTLTCNRENLVCHAIESVLAQTYQDFEYIIVDHGSTDKSGEIAEKYAKKDNRIRVIHSESGTIGHGRNIALDAAHGDYITFVDDDDWVEPDYLEFLLHLILEHHADMAICGSSKRSFDEKKIMTAEETLIEMMWRKRFTVACNSRLYKREIIQKYRFQEDVAIDDITFTYKVISEANCVAYYGLPKYMFYRHEGNTTSWTTNHSLLNPTILNEYLNAYRTRTQWLSKKFSKSAVTFQYFEWSFMISMIEKIDRLKIKGCEKQLEYMTSVLIENRDKFLNCPEMQDFEKEWMDLYI